MKKIKLLVLFAFLFVILPHSAKAQVPTFDCSKSIQVYTDVTTGNVYSCKITAGVGTWMLAGGGGGAFGPNFVAGGGTAQAQTVAPTTAVTNVTLVNGYTICWLPVAANTGAAPTLAGSGTSTFSAKPITKYGTVALVANDITTLGIACVIYDGTEFQLQVPLAGGVFTGNISTGSGASGCGAGTVGCNAYLGGAVSCTPTAGQACQRYDSVTKTFLCSLDIVTEGSCSPPGVVLVPATTVANEIAPTANNVVGLTVVRTTGSTVGDLFDVCDSLVATVCTGKLLYVDNNESVQAANNVIAGNAIGTNSHYNLVTNVPFAWVTAPTISSGFGTSPTVPDNNGSIFFSVNVGTGGTASSGVITMPTANTKWACLVNDITASAANKTYRTVQTASTTTSVTVQNQTAGSIMGPIASVTPVTASNPTINTRANLIQLSLGANYFNTLTQPFLVQGAGNYTTTAASSPALTFNVDACTVSGCGSGTVSNLVSITTTALSATALTNATWTLSLSCATNATGATGNLVCKAMPGLTLDTGATLITPDSTFVDANTATSANIDFTAALFLQFSMKQSVAGASNSYVQTLAILAPESTPVAGAATPWAASDVLNIHCLSD